MMSIEVPNNLSSVLSGNDQPLIPFYFPSQGQEGDYFLKKSFSQKQGPGIDCCSSCSKHCLWFPPDGWGLGLRAGCSRLKEVHLTRNTSEWIAYVEIQSEEQGRFYKNLELRNVVEIEVWKTCKVLVPLNQERSKRKLSLISQLGCNEPFHSKLHILSEVDSSTLCEEKRGQ